MNITHQRALLSTREKNKIKGRKGITN